MAKGAAFEKGPRKGRMEDYAGIQAHVSSSESLDGRRHIWCNHRTGEITVQSN